MINPLYVKWSIIGAMVGSLTPIMIYNIAHYMEEYQITPELVETVLGNKNTETFLGENMVKPSPMIAQPVTQNIAETVVEPVIKSEPKKIQEDNFSKYLVKVSTNLTIPKELGKINKPNFAGSYYILGVGCKTKCEGYKIYNLETNQALGNIKISNERNDVTGIKLHYKVNSKLLIANTYDKENICSAREFLFDKDTFTPLTTKVTCN